MIAIILTSLGVATAPLPLLPQGDAASQATALPAEASGKATTDALQRDAIDAAPKPNQVGTKPKHPPATPNALGNWLGVRSALVDAGVTPVIQYVGVGMANLAGGERRDASYADQYGFGATFDLKRSMGLPGTFQLTISRRRGPHIVALAGLDMQLSPQETFGRGELWRLSQAWYRMSVGPLEAKIGRMTLSEDYSVLRCDFASLYLCGGHNGQVASRVWFNFPVSSWGTRVRIAHKDNGFIQAGVYQINPNDTDAKRNFFVGFKGGRAVNVPVELTITPKVGPGKLPGAYRLGAWYSNAVDQDVVLDERGNLRALTGGVPLQHRGQAGWYFAGRQQLIASAPNGAGGISAFIGASFFTRDTATLERIVGTGLNFSGPLPGRSQDEIGVGIGNSRRNDRLTQAQRQVNLASTNPQPVRSNEWLIEAYYGWSVLPGFILRPDVQVAIHPGGRSDRPAVVLGGFKTILNL